MTIQGSMDQYRRTESPVAAPEMPKHFAVDETYWGYVVRSTQKPPLAVSILQGAAWLVGLAILLATLGLWLVPDAILEPGVIGLKIGLTAVMVGVSLLLMWFASRGTQTEIQIDTRLGEVREVVRNRAGFGTLIGCYGFDAIGSVFIDVAEGRTRSETTEGRLVLRYRNTAQTLEVARGIMRGLGPLRDRIGRDLMVSPRARDRARAPMPRFDMAAA